MAPGQRNKIERNLSTPEGRAFWSAPEPPLAKTPALERARTLEESARRIEGALLIGGLGTREKLYEIMEHMRNEAKGLR